MTGRSGNACAAVPARLRLASVDFEFAFQSRVAGRARARIRIDAVDARRAV